MSSTCPNGYECDQGGAVLPQFRARYSGHTLSRLAEIRHNKTKQTAFPTVGRESMKSQATWETSQAVLTLYYFPILLVLSNWGLIWNVQASLAKNTIVMDWFNAIPEIGF